MMCILTKSCVLTPAGSTKSVSKILKRGIHKDMRLQGDYGPLSCVWPLWLRFFQLQAGDGGSPQFVLD